METVKKKLLGWYNAAFIHSLHEGVKFLIHAQVNHAPKVNLHYRDFVWANLIWRTRGVGTGLADPAAAGPMFEPAFMIQLKILPAIFVKFS